MITVHNLDPQHPKYFISASLRKFANYWFIYWKWFFATKGFIHSVRNIEFTWFKATYWHDTVSSCSKNVHFPWMQKFWNSVSHRFFLFLFLLFFPFLLSFSFFGFIWSLLFTSLRLFFLGLTTCSTKKIKQKRKDLLTNKSLFLSLCGTPFWRHEKNVLAVKVHRVTALSVTF